MPRRWPRRLAPIVVTAGLASIVVSAEPGPSVAALLQAADAYLVDYAQRLSIIAADEVYAQYDTSADRVRKSVRLTGDFVLVGLAAGSIAAFRDVAAIDGSPLRPREERLAAIFQNMKGNAGLNAESALDQARLWTDGSVRHYASPNLHALDQPTIALEFLRKEHQARATFKLESVKRSGGDDIAVLRFTERSTSRLVPMTGGGGAVGRFWIDVASGTVRQTEIGIAGGGVHVRATVKYALDPALQLWLPIELLQQIVSTGPGDSNFSNMGGGPGYRMREAYEGRATYSGFRRVQQKAGV